MSFTIMQNLLLNNLMYMEPHTGPFARLEDFEGRRLRSWVNAMDLSDFKDEDENAPPMTTAQEYRQLINAVKKDRFLMDLRILCVYTDLSEEGGACRSAVFQSHGTKDTAVVFQGTPLSAGSAQWRDNFYSANVSDSPHQLRALAWYREIYRKYHLQGREITMTGHSKGGNKAKYITVLDDTVDHCESFDGEGFSDKFLKRYNDEIIRRQSVIHNHIVNYDYVSLLMNDIGQETYYHGANYGSGGFTENHLANTFIRFDEKGNAHLDIDENGRPAEMKAFDVFCNSYLRSMSDEKRTASLETMSAFLDTVLAVNRSMSADDITHVFLEYAMDENNFSDIAYFLAYLIRYEQLRPEVIGLLESVFMKFDLEGLVQYVRAVAGVLNWQKRILFVSLDFNFITATVAAIARLIPDWVLKELGEDLANSGIRLTMDELRQLQAMLIEIEGNLRTIDIHENGEDLLAEPSEPETEPLTKPETHMRLDGFGLLVNDMVKMIRFYRDVLHFEIREDEDSSNVYLVKDGTLFLLYGRDDFEKMTGCRYKYVNGFNGHFELALYVDTFEEVDEQFERIVKEGGRAVLEPITEPWGQRTCFIADPEGNLIEIGSWNRPFETKDEGRF